MHHILKPNPIYQTQIAITHYPFILLALKLARPNFNRSILAGFICWLTLHISPLYGQYVLKEAGIRTSLGSSIGLEFDEFHPSGFIHAYYSHYFCGKAYGYHLEGGIRGLYYIDRSNLKYAYNQFIGSTDLGTYFKVRASSKHQPNEFSFNLGPKIEFGYLGIDKYNTTFVNGAAKSNLPDTPALGWGLHLSTWYRTPRTRDHSWFYILGAEALSELATKSSSISYSPHTIFIFFGVSTTFWTNR